MIIVGKALNLKELPKSCIDCPFFDWEYDETCVFTYNHMIPEIHKEIQETCVVDGETYMALPRDRRLNACPLREVEG